MTGIWPLVLYLHLLAMAFFLGGQLVVAVAVVPVERSAPDGERMRAIGRRFAAGSAVALTVLLGTGAAMASHFQLWGSETLRLKLALVVLVIVLTLVHIRHPRAHAVQAAVLVGTLAIVWLGVDLGS